MKILYTITKSTIGGAQTHISQLTSSLVDDGHKVAVCSRPGGWLEESTKDAGAEFYPNKSLQNTYNPITLLKAIENAQTAIKEFEPDLISCHSSFAGLVGRMAAEKFDDVNVVFTAHGWGFSEGTPFLRRKLIKLTEKFAAQYTDKIICVSNYDKSLAIDNNIASEDKLITIHNGTEIPDISWDQYPIEDKIKIVFTGRLSQQKAPLLLVKALAELPEELSRQWELTILGGGEKMSKIKSFINEKGIESQVDLRGDVPREEVFAELQQSHIFTLITNWEGFPRSIIEAMSCGLPVIATSLAGIPEAVTEDCGVLVEKGNKEDVKDAFTNMLSDPDLIRTKGEHARDRCIKKFAIEKTIEETKKVYSELQ